MKILNIKKYIHKYYYKVLETIIIKCKISFFGELQVCEPVFIFTYSIHDSLDKSFKILF